MRAAFNTNNRAASILVAISATLNETPSKYLIGLSNWIRSHDHLTASSYGVLQYPIDSAAIAVLSESNSSINTLNPLFSSPTRFSAGTTQFSNFNRETLAPDIPIILWSSTTENPLVSVGNINPDIPSLG
jgi:hypothetical protein